MSVHISPCMIGDEKLAVPGYWVPRALTIFSPLFSHHYAINAKFEALPKPAVRRINLIY